MHATVLLRASERVVLRVPIVIEKTLINKMHDERKKSKKTLNRAVKRDKLFIRHMVFTL